jgi:hypothetical protein
MIENGELEDLPKGYDRIFFKRYLKEIGEDKEEVWRDFNLFFGTGPLQKNVPYSSDVTREVYDEPDVAETSKSPDIEENPSLYQKISMRINLDKLNLYFWIAITVIILGVVGYFAYKQYVFVKNIPPQIKEISVSEYISEMQKQDSLLTPQISQSNTSPILSDSSGVSIELRTLERTWVREIRDDRDTAEYILTQGVNRQISASSSVKFMFGRADGISVWLNGDSLGVMGKADEVVVNLHLTPEGIADKRLKKPTRQVTAMSDTGQAETANTDTSNTPVTAPEEPD